MDEKDMIISKEEEEKISGGDFDIYNPNPILKVFCHKCGSYDLTTGIRFDSRGRKIFVYHCNKCGDEWESLPMPIKPDQK